jgi:murein L,D-transpeptidase YafK
MNLNSVNKEEKMEVSVVEPNRSVEVKDLFFDKPQEFSTDVEIKVYKSNRRLELYSKGEFLGRFKIALGSNSIGDKEKEGDRKTPEGEYYICTRNDKSKYTLSLGISYPNIKDAQKGLNQKLIDKSTFNYISQAINNKKRPPWDTELGGEIMVHGGGNNTDWTWGCIALSDEDIRILWEYVTIGTSITIYP